MYHSGIGVKQDPEKAFRWFKKAAEQGNTKAQYNLGLMYRSGLGVEQDMVKAVMWFKKAAEQELVQAKNILNILS
ncbi:tetratricopeptide repeat protein [Oceanospirillum multiglobuliferum]|uniref:tetratricopeptide repeat protein n=1 Tax=Oceanospirillum multiglobuliferum TaxID=64969 RepID=UPI002285A431|nr:tetratricopeptide repeat protein [Oceanospirillum multiglobuliferum]